jgi:hypothetical protein
VRAVHGQRRGSAERISGLPTTRLAEQDLTIAVTPPSRVLIRLVELESGRSIAGAVVEIPASGLQGRTNQRGLLRFDVVAPGAQSFLVRHPLFGEHRVQIAVQGDQEYEVRLPAALVALEQIEVVARSRVEDARRERGRRMDLMTREQIEPLTHSIQHVGDLARRFPGLQVRDYRLRTGERIVCIESGRGSVSFSSGCRPVMVVLDNVPVRDFAQLLNISPMHLESVEYINAAEAGGRYGTGSARGVLVVYTRGNGPYVQREKR